MKEITKSGGHCCDGCQWIFCDFLRIEKHEIGFKRNTKEGFDIEVEYRYTHHCDLFNGVEMSHGSLNICNKVYGRFYTGKP